MAKRSKSYRRKSYRRKSSYRLMGGNGAAEYAQSVYGSGSEQHAISNTNNQIHMNKMGGGNVAIPIVGGNVAIPIVGGNVAIPIVGGDVAIPIVGGDVAMPMVDGNVAMPMVDGNSNVGGFGMADAIVPAGFLLANTRYSRSIGKRVGQGVGRVSQGIRNISGKVRNSIPRFTRRGGRRYR